MHRSSLLTKAMLQQWINNGLRNEKAIRSGLGEAFKRYEWDAIFGENFLGTYAKQVPNIVIFFLCFLLISAYGNKYW